MEIELWKLDCADCISFRQSIALVASSNEKTKEYKWNEDCIMHNGA